MAKAKIKKGDIVRVIAGSNKGKEGKVLVVDTESNTVVIEGVNIAKKHVRAQGQQQGGIVNVEAPIHISNVMYVHEGTPTRLGIVRETVAGKNGEKTESHRVAKNSKIKGVKVD